ncbi:hypothetical protein GXW82_00430 [Streptacidiphilus sp. 4-A2]|nr:hypothetical protein [Streptacidiphilus sp. 4-A2]
MADHLMCPGRYDIDVTVTVDAVGERRATGRHATAPATTQRARSTGEAST